MGRVVAVTAPVRVPAVMTLEVLGADGWAPVGTFPDSDWLPVYAAIDGLPARADWRVRSEVGDTVLASGPGPASLGIDMTQDGWFTAYLRATK